MPLLGHIDNCELGTFVIILYYLEIFFCNILLLCGINDTILMQYVFEYVLFYICGVKLCVLRDNTGVC